MTLCNICVVGDFSWDNWILIENKLKKINPEYFRIHSIFNKNNEIFRKISNKYYLTFINNSGTNLTKIIEGLIKTCQIWIIFTNFVEYLNIPHLILNNIDNLNYIVVSESLDNTYFYSENIKTMLNITEDDSLQFKKVINKIYEIYNNSERIEKKNDIAYKELQIEDIDKYENLLKNYNLPQIKLNDDIINKLRKNYKTINDEKKERAIKLLYDKKESKAEKQTIRSTKEIVSINYTNAKLNYYKKKDVY